MTTKVISFLNSIGIETKEQWQAVSEHAQTLSDIKAQLEILKKAAWFIKP